MIPDRQGKLVSVGARVRVININPDIIFGLPEDEIADLNSMVSEVFEIVAIIDGLALIEKWWDMGNGYAKYHEIGLRSEDFEGCDE